MNKIVFVKNEFELTKDLIGKINYFENFLLTRIADNVADLNEGDINCFLLFYSVNNVNEFSKDLTFLKDIKTKNANVKIIVLIDVIDIQFLMEIIRLNINGCLENSFFIENTEYIIKNVINTDGLYFSPFIIKNLLDHILPKTIIPEIILTKKQKTVALLLKEGKTYLEISKNLGLSMNTIRMHIRLLYKNLNVHNRYQMINLLKQNENIIYKDKVRNMKRLKIKKEKV